MTLLFICDANGSHLFLSLSVKQMGHTYDSYPLSVTIMGHTYLYLVNGIYYVQVCEQAR